MGKRWTVFGLLLVSMLTGFAAFCAESNILPSDSQITAEGLAEQELDALRLMYHKVSKEELDRKRQILSEKELQLNIKLNSSRAKKERAYLLDLQQQLYKIHQEVELIDEIRENPYDPVYLVRHYQDFLVVAAIGIGGLLFLLIAFALFKHSREMKQLGPVDRSPMESEPKGAGQRVVQGFNTERKSQIEVNESMLGLGLPGGAVPIPLQDLQSHIDNFLIENPNAYNQLMYFIFRQAILWHASDIHMQRSGGWFEVKFRLDGLLHPTCVLDLHREREMINIVKIMSRMKTFEHREAQEGRLDFQMSDHWYDFRVSVVPIVDTEKIVIRIFGDEDVPFNLDRLGLSIDTTERSKEILQQRFGLFLLVGPTGSGKTTTMYSSLLHLQNAIGGLNIVTLEDPVEHVFEGITQIQINPVKNLSFESGFRNILRQDPEVIMIGEIRDGEATKLVTRAAQTGHLVISTVHAVTTLGAVDRMLDLGADPYALHTTLSAVLSQRLVKQVCLHCRSAYQPDPAYVAEAMKILGSGDIEWQQGKGCEHCLQRGYRGRIVLDELLAIPLHERERLAGIENRAQRQEILRQYINHSLYEDGVRKAAAGLTTLDEVAMTLGDLKQIHPSIRT